MLGQQGKVDTVRHAAYGPGQFPARWHNAAYELHCAAWPAPWYGQLDRDRFIGELQSNHTDVLNDGAGGNKDGTLLGYLKWNATQTFYLSRDELSDPSRPSLAAASPAAYVCAYEITTAPAHAWQGLGRHLFSAAIQRWEREFDHAVFCTYSPKRNLTTVLRQLAHSEQYGRPALEAFAHRAGAAASRHIDVWVDRLGEPLEAFIRRRIVPVPDYRLIDHLNEMREHHGHDVIDGVIAAIGIAYNFVLRASSGLPACGPAAFHRALGAEHWRQYPASAVNCADALGLVDHWRYSHDPARREKCARMFKDQRTARARPGAPPDQLLVLA